MSKGRIGLLCMAGFSLALGACGHTGSDHPSAAATSTSTPRHAATTTTPPATAPPTTAASIATTTPPTAVTTTPASTAANCTSSQLSVSETGNSGMGHIGVVLLFRNTSAQTCKLMGYPGVAGLDAAGHQAIQAVRTLNGYMRVLPVGEGPPVVTLAGGQVASAFVEGTDVPTGGATSCPSYPKLLVTPPNTYQSVTINASMPGCSPVQVHPVVPGTSGSIVT